MSITTADALASKNSPSKVIVLKPDFDILIAASRESTSITLPKRKVLSGLNLLSHFTYSDYTPITPESFGTFNSKSGIASRGIILSFGSFFSLTD